jgi:hypothetical protein
LHKSQFRAAITEPHLQPWSAIRFSRYDFMM